MSHIVKSLVAGVISLGIASASHAAVNLVTNGGFEQTTLGTSAGIGSLYPSNNATGWTTSGYNFVYTPGTADTTGAPGQYGNVKLWGPGDGANNGLTASSPAGGNFLAADGAYETAPITQTINGLVVGAQYQLSFYWAGAQQYNYNGATTEGWTVSLGNSKYDTGALANVNHGFTGWQTASTTFTATSTSELLSFLAHGTPNGEPPFSLLDGVSLTKVTGAVPEPASWAMMIVGFGAVGGALRRHRRSVGTRIAA